MELDTIIYIIITISIFVISLLGHSKRQKKIKPEIEDNVEYSLNDFEKILLRKEEFKKAETSAEQNDIIQTRTDETTLAAKDENHSKTPFKAIDKETDDGFDIKSAIIYSSILERKKFRR